MVVLLWLTTAILSSNTYSVWQVVLPIASLSPLPFGPYDCRWTALGSGTTRSRLMRKAAVCTTTRKSMSKACN